MHFDPTEILKVLDNACEAFTFPMLDNGYVYLAATRLSVFRSDLDWALVIEVFGYSPRAGLPDTHIHTFASTAEAYQDYLANNPNNESRFIYPIADGDWINSEDAEAVAVSGKVCLRDVAIPLPSPDEYGEIGIVLEGERPAVFELCRYLAAKWRESVLASPSERRVSILPEYWDDGISEEERASWSGDAARIASRIPGVQMNAISRYFRHWDLGEEDPGKAFPEDQFRYHDCWQMCDFTRKIGLRYPLDDTGRVLGETYEFFTPAATSRG